MSVFPKENIKTVAESLGLNVKEEVCVALAQDVEYRINEVVQEAIKFMKHSRRTDLKVEDISNALRLKTIEPVYGFANGPAKKFRKTTVANSDVYYIEDEEVDFETILNAPLPKIPLDVTFTAHWLAIEGVQPAIPQNPPLPSDGKNSSKTAKKQGKSSAQGAKNTAGSTTAAATEHAQVKPLVKHMLSKELQLYYERVTSAILGQDDVLRTFALNSLSRDPGLHQLLPYFVFFIGEKITKHLKDLHILDSILSMVQSVLDNPNFFLEPYLHQLMPGILSCLVGKRVGTTISDEMTAAPGRAVNHWALRSKAANLIAEIIQIFGKSYQGLHGRISRTLLRGFLDPSKPLTTQFGAITGLAMLGAETIKVVILPNLKGYSETLEKEREKEKNRVPTFGVAVDGDAAADAHKEDLEHCYQAILSSVKKVANQSVADAPFGITPVSVDIAEKQRSVGVQSLRDKCGNWIGDGLAKELSDGEKVAILELFPKS